MMSNAEIRALPERTISPEIQTIVSQDCFSVIAFDAYEIEQYVILDVYTRKEKKPHLKYRYIINGLDVRLYHVEKNKINEGYLNNAIERNCGYEVQWYCSEETRNFLQSKLLPDSAGVISINSIISRYDDLRRYANAKKRRDAIEEEIDNEFAHLKKLPKDIEKTACKAMKEYTYIFFNRKEDIAVCSHCGHEQSIKSMNKFIEFDKGMCPSCKRKIIYRSHTRHSRMVDEGMIAVIQSFGSKRLIVRYINITQTYNSNLLAERKLREVIRSIIDFNTNNVKDYEWYFFNGKQRWCYPQPSMFHPDGIHHNFYKGELHKNGLAKELKKAGLYNICSDVIRYFYSIKTKKESNIYQRFIRAYEFLCIRPYVERIVKSGLTNLAKDLYMTNYSLEYVNSFFELSKTDVVGLLKLNGKGQFKELVKINPGFDEIKVIQRYNKENFKPRSIKRILQIYEDIGDMDEVFKMPDSKIDKLMKYFETQSIMEKRSFYRDYFDYLSYCKKLQYNLKSSMVLYPYDFKKAHDEAYTCVKDEENKEMHKIVDELLPAIHEKYDYTEEEGDYLIMAPNKAKDIIYEGQAMNHCVGGYVGDVAKEKCSILFLRTKKEPDKPFVTMEIRNNRVCQARTFGNGQPDEDTWAFIERFKLAKNIS